MTMPMGMRRRTPLPPPARLVRALVAVGAARVLAHQPPSRIGAVLRAARRGARAASRGEAGRARDDVTAVSLVCRAPHGCVPRSIATALLCRMTGTWPTWRVGVRTHPPFAAHAWVEAEGSMIGEEEPPGYFRPLMAVEPPGSAAVPAPGGAAVPATRPRDPAVTR